LYTDLINKAKSLKKPESLNSANEDSDNESFIIEDKSGVKPNPDMKNILGYLN
jgi:hypothetical protein